MNIDNNFIKQHDRLVWITTTMYNCGGSRVRLMGAKVERKKKGLSDNLSQAAPLLMRLAVD